MHQNCVIYDQDFLKIFLRRYLYIFIRFVSIMHTRVRSKDDSVSILINCQHCVVGVGT